MARNSQQASPEESNGQSSAPRSSENNPEELDPYEQLQADNARRREEQRRIDAIKQRNAVEAENSIRSTAAWSNALKNQIENQQLNSVSGQAESALQRLSYNDYNPNDLSRGSVTSLDRQEHVEELREGGYDGATAMESIEQLSDEAKKNNWDAVATTGSLDLRDARTRASDRYLDEVGGYFTDDVKAVANHTAKIGWDWVKKVELRKLKKDLYLDPEGWGIGLHELTKESLDVPVEAWKKATKYGKRAWSDIDLILDGEFRIRHLTKWFMPNPASLHASEQIGNIELYGESLTTDFDNTIDKVQKAVVEGDFSDVGDALDGFLARSKTRVVNLLIPPLF